MNLWLIVIGITGATLILWWISLIIQAIRKPDYEQDWRIWGELK